MTTSSRITEILKCMLVNAPCGINLAVPAETIHQSRPLRQSSFWRESLATRDDRTLVTEWDGLKLRGLASARMSSGPRAWMIDRLFLPKKDSLTGPFSSTGLELLEAVAQAAGQHRAERVFLRVPSDSPVIKIAQRTGYYPYYEEVHLQGQPAGQPDLHSPDSSGGEYPLVPLMPQDELSLFQLYCAATPQQVRAGYGLTLNQWRDGQEGPLHRPTEDTTWEGGRMTGWLAFDFHGGVGAGRVLHRPDHPEILASLLATACARPGEQSWLLPDYQEPVATTLLRNGLTEAGRYTMLIKTVTVPVVSREYSMAEA
jgi:hypothetical protein